MISKNLSVEVDFIRDPSTPSTITGVGLESVQELAIGDPDRVGLVSRAAAKQASGVISAEESQKALEDGTLLEVIIGTNNLLPAWFLEVGATYTRPVCKIETSGTNFRGERGTWSGTGFLISPNILLTNHHVLNSTDSARNAKCIFNYQQNQNGKLSQTKEFIVNPNKLFVSSPVSGGLDFTFVWVEGEPGSQFGFIPMDRSFFKIATRENANIIQHPSGDPKCVVLQDNLIQFQDEVVVHYTSDTQPGSSGSSVFNNEWKLVALHHASKSQTSGPHPHLNEGIKISAIATYLEKLTEDPRQRSAAQTLLNLFGGTNALTGFFGALGRKVPQQATGHETVVDELRGEADDIDVGFWNIEWFNRHYEEKLDDVAKIIVSMNLDVWAFEEASAEATAALVAHLRSKYHMDFAWEASESNASSGKQTTTVIWNTKTVHGEKQSWPDEIDQWFKVDSRDFDELDLESVEGKVFNRYPGLFYFRAANRSEESEFNFYLVPLHLKAMDEGSRRRRLAAQILGAAVQKMIQEHQSDEDWILGGDYNAELATQDFQQLIAQAILPISAQDEDEGVFSYLKSPKSLIDHIFLSANLAKTYGEDDFFIVAADKTIPNYIEDISDHRPVLVRLSLKAQGASSDRSQPERSELDPLYEALRPVRSPNGSRSKMEGSARTAQTSAKFEGFFLQMSLPNQREAAERIVSSVLGTGWQVKPIADSTTEFEVLPQQASLSVQESWDKTYTLRSQPGVINAEPLFTVPLPERPTVQEDTREFESGIQNQPLPGSQKPEWNLEQLHVYEAWELIRAKGKQPGAGIVVGHPDTGYSRHPEIVENLLIDQGYDFLKQDRNAEDELESPPLQPIPNPGHGTSTASVIVSPERAQQTFPNAKWVTGVAPAAKLMPLRVTYSVVLWSVRNLAEAIEYAADKGAHIISMSLGTGFPNERLRSAISYAQKRGVIVLSAAGNFVRFVVWPAAYDEVVAVAASNVNREIWQGSSRGDKVDVTAPGESVWSAQVKKRDGGVVYEVEQGSGTSFAVTAVAGVAALWLAYHGRDELIRRYGAEKIPFLFNQILRQSCDKPSANWDSSQFGQGIVNAKKVLETPLPSSVSLMAVAPEFTFRETPPIDQGGLETFTHLFEDVLADQPFEARSAGNGLASPTLQSRLAELLQIPETELPRQLKEVGQELAFHLVTNPKLYAHFVSALQERPSVSDRTTTESTTISFSSMQLEEVRQLIESSNVSQTLKNKIGASSYQTIPEEAALNLTNR